MCVREREIERVKDDRKRERELVVRDRKNVYIQRKKEGKFREKTDMDSERERKRVREIQRYRVIHR